MFRSRFIRRWFEACIRHRVQFRIANAEEKVTRLALKVNHTSVSSCFHFSKLMKLHTGRCDVSIQLEINMKHIRVLLKPPIHVSHLHGRQLIVSRRGRMLKRFAPFLSEFREAISQSIKPDIKNENFVAGGDSRADKKSHQNLLYIKDVEINEAIVNTSFHECL